VSHTFVQDGEYEIQIWLMRDLEGNVSGLREPRAHELMVLVDRQPVAHFTIEKPAGADATVLDKDLKARVNVRAGPHEIAVTFVKGWLAAARTARQPLQSHFNDRRHPRSTPAIDQISMTGPYEAKGAENTPSRRRLFVCRPDARRSAGADVPPASHQEEACAKTILTTLMRRAYRRPVASAEVERPMAFYREGPGREGFRRGHDEGIERGPHQPGVPVPRRKRAQEHRRRRCLPNQRSRAGVPPLVLPVEQHSRR